MEKSYSGSMRRSKIFRTSICVIFCLISLIPFLLLIINSTRTSEAIKTGVTLLPSSHFVENWTNLMKKQDGMQVTLWSSMRNSLLITVPGTILAVYCSAMTAYGIHVYDFKMKKFAWAFIMAILMIPNQITIIGFYRFMLQLNLVDTYWPLILPCIAAPGVVFFMKQYMESTLSIEMIEAARIDGAKEFKIFNTIITPLLKPALATQAIFQFIAQWNELFKASIMLTSDKKKTLPMFVQMLTADQFKVDFGIIYVGLFVTIIPLVIVYFILSRHIIAGVALGGVKG